MTKVLRPVKQEPGKNNPDFIMYCPGCECSHGIWTTRPNEFSNAIWSFDGNLEKPSFTPSLKIRGYDYTAQQNTLCHFIVTSGRIEYQKDCTHYLRDKTVDMESDE